MSSLSTRCLLNHYIFNREHKKQFFKELLWFCLWVQVMNLKSTLHLMEKAMPHLGDTKKMNPQNE